MMNTTNTQGEGDVRADERFRQMSREFVNKHFKTDADDSSTATMRELVAGAKIVMLTSSNEKGGLSSRPLTLQSFDEDGTMFFIVPEDTDWLHSSGITNVNVAFSEGVQGFVSIAGVAVRDDDADKIESMWDVASEAFFPGGPDRSDAILLRVDPRRIEWWSTKNKLRQFWEMTRAFVTDEEPELGNKGTINVKATLGS